MQIPKINPNHKRRVPTQKQRNEFSKEVRERVMEEENGLCQMCGDTATQLHHVRFRSQQGRGVYTNAMALCNGCHVLIHRDNELKEHWQKLYEIAYGTDYYKDEWDD